MKLGIQNRNFSVLIKHPLLIPGTVWATLQSSGIAERAFADSHYGNGIANAFKHALWSALLAKHNQWALHSTQKAVDWSRFFTDLHETNFPNPPQEKQMDLYNNQLGREIYIGLWKKYKTIPSTRQIVEEIKSNKRKLRVL